jgi:hypothetical protein
VASEARQVTGLPEHYFYDDREAGSSKKSVRNIRDSSKGQQKAVAPLGYTKLEVPIPSSACQIEFESPQGFKMRIGGIHMAPLDLMHLFFERGVR